MTTARTHEATALMMQFADRTGLSSEAKARRYLWTDAFAVCNFLGLARVTSDEHLQELALRLVEQVHHELGRHRADDARRTGWLSGLSHDGAEAHPTRCGLRIGKPLPERALGEPLDPDREWDRDGQYFHYLTKWMHALDQVARTTGRATFNAWARELADVAHDAFTYGPPRDRQMVWKLSIDLSRPLVPSMGQHDPLDGFVTCVQLDATATALQVATGPSLTEAAADFAGMLAGRRLATSDPLGIGGLLVDACRLAQLETHGELITSLLVAAVVGLRRYVTEPDLRAPAHMRLAFRELGLAIGLAGVTMLRAHGITDTLDAPGQESLAEIAEYEPLRSEIESFWMRPHHRETSTWLGHADINEVMLATSLAPDGFLALPPPTKPPD